MYRKTYRAEKQRPEKILFSRLAFFFLFRPKDT